MNLIYQKYGIVTSAFSSLPIPLSTVVLNLQSVYKTRRSIYKTMDCEKDTRLNLDIPRFASITNAT